MSPPAHNIDSINLLLIEACKADVVLAKANLRCSEHPVFHVRHAATCRAGIDALSSWPADVVLLDLNLPDSVGLETLKSVREFATGIPIVVMTELNSEQEAIDAVHLGAQDCFEKSEAITKPLGQLLQYSIERYHRQTAEREIASAAFVQRRLFPSSRPVTPKLDIAGRCDPANDVGGDYYDYFTVGDNEVMVVIGDVTGHGFGPSLVMAETRAALRTMAATTNDVGTMMGQVNGLIHDHDFGWFVTLFLVRINIETGRCKYASAGQPALLHRADGTILDLQSDDHPLGIVPGTQFQVAEILLCDGDTLLLYTDGITERAAGPTEFYGVDRIIDHLKAAGSRSAVETLDRIFDDANRFADFRAPVDDMTGVVVKVVCGGEQSPDRS